MIYAPQAISDAAAFVYLVSQDAAKNGWCRAGSGFIPGGTIPLSEIQVGETMYRLRKPVQGLFISNRGRGWEFWVGGFAPSFVGQGSNAEESFDQWRDQVHETFQQLYGKRPFEMNSDEQSQWEILQNMIDVVGYQNETPLLVRQLGHVTQARPEPRQITWTDGRKETVRLDVMPGEFAAYKPGQWFEAIVERDPLTWHLRRVRYVQRTATLRRLSQALLASYWSSLPTTKSLPESKRDWTEE
jgi:hypothetical protein